MAGDAIFTAKTLGAPHVARKLSAGARELRGIMLREFHDVAPHIESVFARHAPYDEEERDDYHMSEHVEAVVEDVGRAVMTVHIEAISPETGFNYLKVTRFGHKAIYPVKGRRLKWESEGKTRFAASTPAFTPLGDWVESARYEADRITGDISDRVGRQIATRVL